MSGRRCSPAPSPTTRPAPGGPRSRTSSWPATGGSGGRSSEECPGVVPMKTEIRVVEDGAALARAAADEFEGRAREAVAAGGAFRVVLSGGSTPRGLLSLLAGEPYRARLPWGAIHFFWGHEPPLPPRAGPRGRARPPDRKSTPPN